MKVRDTALKLKRFEIEERARKVGDLEQMIREFESIATDLDRQIQAEEERSGVKDPKHFAYSTFAKSAAQRRDNLRASIGELRAKLEATQADLDDARQQLALAANTEPPREIGRVRRRHERTTGIALR